MTRQLPLCAALVALLAGCDGDYFPLERTARELFNGWDMWDDEAIGPHQGAMPGVPAGSVPVDAAQRTLAAARAHVATLPAPVRQRHGALAYRRFCHHCHGPHGDGRIIVGESFSPALPDLRARLHGRSDEELYTFIARGSARMIPLEGVVTPLEALLAIEHARTLRDAPSRPFFPPQSVTPIR